MCLKDIDNACFLFLGKRSISSRSTLCKSQLDFLQKSLFPKAWFALKPGFHMIVTVGEASPSQARGHRGYGCVKWKQFLNDVADQPGTVRDASKELR